MTPGIFFFYLGHHDGSLSPVGFMELDHLGQGVLAYDVAVEDEERLAGVIDQLVSG